MTYCKIERVEKKNIFGRKVLRKVKTKHSWDLVKIGKFMITDRDGTSYMVKFRCSVCGAEHDRHFAHWAYLQEIGVPVEILKKHQRIPYDYPSYRFGDLGNSELETPIPTTFYEDIDLY